MTKPVNLLYAQSGGVTAVINASAAGVIAAARRHPGRIGKVLAARHGILGVLGEELLDTTALSDAEVERLKALPGGAFGSCRLDLDSLDRNPAQYERLFQVFKAHDIGVFLYNGGNGSMETARQVAEAAARFGHPLQVIGVPKTVDNDIVATDCCPGYGSAAKYLATSVLEAGLDVESMSTTGGRVFVMEVMGRNAGWLAAACALAARTPAEGPHLVLLPEVPFNEAAFLAEVGKVVARLGYCTVVVSEGLRGPGGEPLMLQGRDAKGYVQLGGAGEVIARRIHAALGYKVHFAVADYLQRAARHLASATDVAQAVAVGEAAVETALAGGSGVMISIRRTGEEPYRWETGTVALETVANLERRLPTEFIRPDGFGVTEVFRRWCQPLLAGEAWPAFSQGLPDYRRPEMPLVEKQLPAWED